MGHAQGSPIMFKHGPGHPVGSPRRQKALPRPEASEPLGGVGRNLSQLRDLARNPTPALLVSVFSKLSCELHKITSERTL